MASIEFGTLDVQQGFNYNRDVQPSFGFVYSLQIGDGSQIKVDSDITVKEPTGNEAAATVAGVLTSITYDGGHGDPIKFKFNITTQNKQKIQKLLHEKLNNTTCKIAFKVFEYDSVAKEWFQAFYNEPSDSSPLNGLIAKDGPKLVMEIEKAAATEVLNPQNWGFTLNVMPAQQTTAQTLQFLTGKGMKVSKQWGIPVAAGTA